MQHNKRTKKKTVREYSPESLMFRSIMGVVLIALGVIALLSILTRTGGTIFDMVRDVVQGLGGILCLGIPLFLVWGGILLTFSARTTMPVRGIALTFIFYLCLLAIINLLSKVGELNFLEHIVKYNAEQQPPVPQPKSFGSMLSACYKFCARLNTFGGALGMIFGWVLWTYVGTTGGVVVLVALCLVCAMFFSRFDLIGWGKEWKVRSDERLEEKERQRQEQAMQQPAANSKPQNVKTPAFLRRGKKGDDTGTDGPGPVGVPQPQPVPMGFGPMGQGNVFPFPFPMPGGQPMGQSVGQPVGQPIGQPIGQSVGQPGQSSTQQVELYDEMILPQTGEAPEFQLGGKKKGRSAANPFGKPTTIQTEMTFTPGEVGGVKPTGREARKLAARMEEISKRKAELAQEIFQAGQTEPLQPDGFQERTIAVSTPVAAVQPSYPQATVAVEGPAVAQRPAAAERVQRPAAAVDKTAAYKRPAASIEPTSRQETLMTGQRLDTPELKLPDTRQAGEAVLGEEPKQPYAYPTLDLLNMQQARPVDTRETDTVNAAKLEKTLESFGIPARVKRVTHGPAVTRFELGLISSGINVKRITSIADNIALEMAANGGVRIEIPIPGTNLFGIEIPNKEVMSVSLGEVLVSPEMSTAKSALAVALGKDIAGRAVVCDLAKMPHLLIAGQTGSGKSVCINTIINSILFRSSPEEVRMIMIDPKVVELQCYNVVPHLLIPVVSDPHKAAGALAWAVAEMLDRYHKMQSKNVRELNAYNAKMGPGEERLPRIVIVIDELADLMLACKKEVEESIIRLAQLARAAGIHMLVATQRPTVDVITGLIKANIPSRIAFAVSSSIDSRTILDMNGAEKLLGRGDMFYFPTGASAPIRVQGCFLSDGEIERVVDYIGEHGQAEFDPNILEALEAESEPVNGLDDMGDGGIDDKLQEAIEMVISDGQASISMLQRRMKIGYARAGRLIDDMAARNIVSKSAGSKPREVLMSREEYERLKDTLLR